MKHLNVTVALLNFIGSIASISGVTLLWFKAEYQITAATVAATVLTILILVSIFSVITIAAYLAIASSIESIKPLLKLGASIICLTLVVAYWAISIKAFSLIQPVIIHFLS
jgi:hypothetical protein